MCKRTANIGNLETDLKRFITGRRGEKSFLPIIPTSGFSFFTGRDHNKVARRRFLFTFYSKLTYILT